MLSAFDDLGRVDSKTNTRLQRSESRRHLSGLLRPKKRKRSHNSMKSMPAEMLTERPVMQETEYPRE